MLLLSNNILKLNVLHKKKLKDAFTFNFFYIYYTRNTFSIVVYLFL